MYLKSFTLRNIKCFEEVRLDFPAPSEGNFAGWNVLLGTNATGKTTLLQAMAVALIGASPGMRLVAPGSWVRLGADYGELDVEFLSGDRDAAVGAPRGTPYHASFAITGNKPTKPLEGNEYTSATIVLLRGRNDEAAYRGLLKGPYATDKEGWLACGYGSFRRFFGGTDNDLMYEPRVGRVASLFKESVALFRNMQWLPGLYSRSQNKHARTCEQDENEYQTILSLLNELLPPSVKICDVDTERVYFEAPGASRVDLAELSDGYRSFLALVMDLLRQIAEAFSSVASLVKTGPDGKPYVLADGVVLIDEGDLHLHPSWQRQIGPKLRAVFPRIQFIVSSHSPFIAQEATPNGLFVLRNSDDEKPVRCIQPLPRVDGWTVDEILKSPLFGLTNTRSIETEKLLNEHASLRGKQKFGGLSAEDKARLEVIEGALAEQMTSPAEDDRRKVDAKIKEAAAKLRKVAGA